VSRVLPLREVTLCMASRYATAASELPGSSVGTFPGRESKSLSVTLPIDGAVDEKSAVDD